MLGQGDKDCPAGGTARRAYLRSVSWTDRSPTKPDLRRQPNTNNKARSFLPPLQPLSISRRNVEEWPRAGSDDLGVWPNPQTPRGPIGKQQQQQLDDPNREAPPAREFQFNRDKLAFFDKECSRIADHIYLGSDAVAKNLELLKQNGITHVLNCVGFVSPEYFKNDFVYKTLWLRDTPSEDITSILYDVFDYFEDVREQGGRVLVHCCQGVSRSTSLVIAYLMWRKGQSFEDAFQYVKAARGVTNPNMGFACQLLQCQKRVHAMPSSASPVLRMYRMAPHSPYAPLHLVPKMLSHPSAERLDSRGAFIVHVPSAIYIWIGKNCSTMMLNKAKDAASQVIRYERARGPVVSIKEGEEPSGFWDALADKRFQSDGYDSAGESAEEASSATEDMVSDASNVGIRLGERKVSTYDTDYEIFHKALAGGVVPPFSVSNTGLETCLPVRENGWNRLRQKFASGRMKEFVAASKLKCNTSIVPTDGGLEKHDSPSHPSSPSNPLPYPCGSPDSFSYFLNRSSDMMRDDYNEEAESVICTDPLSSAVPTPSCGSPDSFSSLPVNNVIFSSKSPTLSPSTSDYASSFTFSPSSSNWSDLSYVSSQQPSPSGLESSDLCSQKKSVPLLINPRLPCKENPPSPRDSCLENQALQVTDASLPCKGTFPSIAERRGSNPPPRMMLPSVDEAPSVHRNMVKSWSFSLDDGVAMKDSDCAQSEIEGPEGYVRVLMLDADPSRPAVDCKW